MFAMQVHALWCCSFHMAVKCKISCGFYYQNTQGSLTYQRFYYLKNLFSHKSGNMLNTIKRFQNPRVSTLFFFFTVTKEGKHLKPCTYGKKLLVLLRHVGLSRTFVLPGLLSSSGFLAQICCRDVKLKSSFMVFVSSLHVPKPLGQGRCNAELLGKLIAI